MAVGERVHTTTDELRDVAYGLGDLCIPFHMFHQTRGRSEHPLPQTQGGSEHLLPDSLLPANQPTTRHSTRSPGKLWDGLGPAAGPAAATDSTAIMGWADVHSVLRELHYETGRTGATF